VNPGIIKNMQKVPVYMLFGSDGILGKAFSRKIGATSTDYRLFMFDHARADITNPNHINPLMEYVRPTVVINCAAINDEDLCQDAKSGAFSVNAKGPAILAEACEKYGAKLVHFSSASVFDGKRHTPYSEKNIIKPVNILGESKASGEDAIKNAINDYLIIRPGWVFSYDSPSCITSWIELAEKEQEIAVLDDHIGSPTYAVDLVDATLDLISRDAKGIFHIANSDAATVYRFVESTLALSDLRTKVITVPEAQSFFKAPMPRYTVLSTKKYSQLAGKELRPWLEALKHCLFYMERYKP
jgi:dTDP-4-dehydrorhamnose reductase